MRKLSPYAALVLAATLSTSTLAQAPVLFGTHYYEFVAANITWQNAITAATSSSHQGIPGHLATITSAAENAFLVSQYGGYPSFTGAWIAGQLDANSVASWAAGPEIGLVFSNGQTPVPGVYANWGGIEPNNAPGFVWINLGPSTFGIDTGKWVDDDNGTPSGSDPVVGYIIEYEVVPSCNSTGTGCGGLSLTCDTLPAQGSAFDFTLTGTPTGGYGAVVLKLGPPTAGVPAGSPFVAGCQNYLGAGPNIDLNLTMNPVETYSLAVPILPGLLGLPLGLQGVALNFVPFETYSSNGLGAVVGS